MGHTFWIYRPFLLTATDLYQPLAMLVAYNLIQLAVNKKTGTLYLLHIHIIPEPLFNEH